MTMVDTPPEAASGFAVGAVPAPALAASWCLRFTAGDMKGRTITLRRGLNSAGSAAGCDIVLPGGDVRPRHAALEVGQLAITVQAEGDAPVQLNGEAIGPQRRALVVGDTVRLGPVELQLDRLWPSADRESSAADWREGTPPPAPGAGAPGTRRLGRPQWAALVLLAAAGLLAAAWVLAVSAAGGPGSAARRTGLAQAIAGYPEVELVVGPRGEQVVKGIVESRERKEALVRAVAAEGNGAAMQVQAVDELLEHARRYLADPNLAVSYAGAGRLVVSGSVEGDTARNRVRALGEDLHPLVRVVDKLQAPAPADTARTRDAEQRAQWAAWQALLPARIVSVSEDRSGRRYLQLANGSRLYEGTVLRSGAEITRIEEDRLVITGADAPAPK